MDKMSKDCKLEALKYKKVVTIPKLGYVDNIIDENQCGDATVKMNDYTIKEINERKLQLSTDKCARMHIGRKTKKQTEGEHKCKNIYVDKRNVIKRKVGEKLILED